LCLTPLVPGCQYGGDWYSCMLHHMSNLLATSELHFFLIHKISATISFNIVTLLFITFLDMSLVSQVINFYHNLHHHHHHHPYSLVLNLTFICPCIVNIILNYNQQDATFPDLFISTTDALHVSGGSSAHHQEHKTVHTASGIVNQYCCLLLSWMR
jgi:hypothetical protein